MRAQPVSYLKDWPRATDSRMSHSRRREAVAPCRSPAHPRRAARPRIGRAATMLRLASRRPLLRQPPCPSPRDSPWNGTYFTSRVPMRSPPRSGACSSPSQLRAKLRNSPADSQCQRHHLRRHRDDSPAHDRSRAYRQQCLLRAVLGRLQHLLQDSRGRTIESTNVARTCRKAISDRYRLVTANDRLPRKGRP